MAQYLELVRSLPPLAVKASVKQLLQLEHSAYRTECKHEAVSPAAYEFSPAASAVLDSIVKAGAPILHSQIVKAMAKRGYPKREAYAAIEQCQRQGWIEHNLTTGYILSRASAAGPT